MANRTAEIRKQMEDMNEVLTPMVNEDATRKMINKVTDLDLRYRSNRVEAKTLTEEQNILNMNLENIRNEDEKEDMVVQLTKMNNDLKRISEQVRVQRRPETAKNSLNGEQMTEENSRIYTAAIEDDWASVQNLFNNDEDLEKLSVMLSPTGDTALHIAVGTNQSHNFVENIVKRLARAPLLLRTENQRGNTALHIAARVGNVTAAKDLVFADPGIVTLKNNRGDIPLWFAAWGNDVATLHYLLGATLQNEIADTELENNMLLISLCIKSGHYDVALFLIRRYPRLVCQNPSLFAGPLTALASRPDAFRSGMTPGFFKEIIYPLISVDRDRLAYTPDRPPAERGERFDPAPPAPRAPAPAPGPKFGRGKRALFACTNVVRDALEICFWILAFILFEPLLFCFRHLVYIWFRWLGEVFVKEVHDEKRRHQQAQRLVQYICTALLSHRSNEINVYEEVLQPAVCAAIKNGCIELIEECINMYPGIIWCTGPEYSFIGLAIKHRQVKVFNLIYQMSAHKTYMLNHRSNNQNALHAAGELPPYHRLISMATGPALQLQRELLWFQKVEEFSETSSLYFANKESKKPRELFTEQHKDLLRDAQEWTKATSSSSTVVAALIVTITFAAMLTVPGGLNTAERTSAGSTPPPTEEGIPEFLNKNLFLVFAFADTAAIFFSAISVISFLSTLTCLTQEDFLSKVPWRLTFGFSSLFMSLITTVVAFCATLVLMLETKVHWIWIMATSTGILPIILYSFWQLPLIFELLGGLFGKGIFHNKKKDLTLIH